MRPVIEPSFATKLSRIVGKSARAPRMRTPSALPTIYPTQSSYLQRLLWLFNSKP